MRRFNPLIPCNAIRPACRHFGPPAQSGSESGSSPRVPCCHQQFKDSLCGCSARRCPGVCHLRCLTPPQSTPPRGRWYCRFCKARKLTTGFKLVRKRCALIVALTVIISCSSAAEVPATFPGGNPTRCPHLQCALFFSSASGTYLRAVCPRGNDDEFKWLQCCACADDITCSQNRLVCRGRVAQPTAPPVVAEPAVEPAAVADEGGGDEDDDAPLAELIGRPRSASTSAGGGTSVRLGVSHRS